MAEIVKIIGIAFISAITGILLKGTKPELAFAVTVTGVILCLTFLLDMAGSAISSIGEIVALTGMENGLVRVLLKIVGVGYLTEFSAGVLNDFGSTATADKVALGGKLVILILSLPIIEALLELVKGFLQLL